MLHGGKHIKRTLERFSTEHKEDVARWKKDYPRRKPGYSLKTDKSYSKIRKPSEQFREQYDLIAWD